MTFIRRIIFHILLAIRGILLGFSRLLAFGCFFGFFGLMTESKFQSVPLIINIMILIFGIIFTLINWFYDDLIFYFEPKNMKITLYR